MKRPASRRFGGLLLLLAAFGCHREEHPPAGSKPGASPSSAASPRAASPRGSSNGSEALPGVPAEPVATRADCEAMAAEVVNALPEVKRAIAQAVATADESGGRARFGGIGSNDADGGGFNASIGLHTDERFEEQIGYSIDRKGVLQVTVRGEELVLSPEASKAVERVCRTR